MRTETTKDTTKIEPLLEEWKKQYNPEPFGLAGTIEAAVGEMDILLDTLPGDIILCYDDDALVGFFAIFAIASPFSEKLVALEKYWFALPNHGTAGVRLFNAGKQWAKDNDCSHFVVASSNLASDMHDKVAEFLKHTGMQLFETSFIMRIE